MVKKDKTEFKVKVPRVSNTEQHIKRPLISKPPMSSNRDGYLISLVDDPNFASGCELGLQRHKQPRKWTHLRLNGSTERISYTATNFGERAAITLPYKYAVALVDDSNNTVTMYDVEQFNSEKSILKLERLAAEKTALEAARVGTNSNASATSEYLKSRALLGESFGTKKTKQILGSFEKHKIDIGQLEAQAGFIGRNLDNSILRIATEREEQDVQAGEVGGVSDVAANGMVVPEGSILPPHNAQGKAPKDIYKVQNIIPTAVYFSLNVASFAEAIFAKDNDALNTLKEEYNLQDPVDVRLRSLLYLPKAPEKKALEHTLKCLLYVNYLFLFRNLNESKINSGTLPLPHVSSELSSSLLEKFTEGVAMGNGSQRHKLSSLCKDRLVSYLCVLLLCLDGFRTNVAQLSCALRLPVTRTGDYLRAVGCTLERPEAGEPIKYKPPGVDREIPVKMAVLKTPLKIELNRSKGAPTRRR